MAANPTYRQAESDFSRLLMKSLRTKIKMLVMSHQNS